jgi:hypothetical protein
MESPLERDGKRKRQLIDWSAAVWAGVLAGAVFFIAVVFAMPLAVGGSPWVIVRYFASIVLGPGTLAPPAAFTPSVLAAAIAIHFSFAIGFALLISFVIHKGGLWGGIAKGALLGAAIYAINIFTLTLLFPWFFALHGPLFLAVHIVYGAVVGWIYEGLEVETFVTEDA